MHRLQPLLLLLLVLFFQVRAHAQISHGGSPWLEGVRPEPIVLPALDLERLRAEDAVTDPHKDIPWRYGVEHDVLWDSEHAGVWSIEQEHMVWRLAIDGAGSTCLALRFRSFQIPKGATCSCTLQAEIKSLAHSTIGT